MKSSWAVKCVFSAILLLLFFRNLVVFRMSYLRNQMRFWKHYFTFKFFPEYSFKIANLIWHKLEVMFYCQSYDIIFVPKKPLKSKIQKHTLVGNTKFYKNCIIKKLKISLKEITSWWQLTRHVTRASTVPKTGSRYLMAARMQTHHLRQLHTL